MSKIKCVVIDDEPHSIGVMKMQIEAHCPELEIVDTFTDSIDAYSFLKNNAVDLVFIDIEMPRLNGFELLNKLGTFSFKPVVVSAYDEFGIKAVKHRIFDYLVKPIDPEELKLTVIKYNEEMMEHSQISRVNDRILLPLGSQVDFVEIEEIVRCESDKNYTTVYLKDRRSCVVSKTLKTIEDILPKELFVRVHNKHLVNISQIKSYVKVDGGSFKMSDESEVPLSRYRKDDVFKKLGIR